MSVKIDIGAQPPHTLEEILGKIFWKQPHLVKTAKDFLHTIKQWSKTEQPYTVDQWQQYTVKTGITQSTYHNMLKRLKQAGMVEKAYNQGRGKHELKMSKKFSQPLEQMAAIWDNYLDE